MVSIGANSGDGENTQKVLSLGLTKEELPLHKGPKTGASSQLPRKPQKLDSRTLPPVDGEQVGLEETSESALLITIPDDS